MRILVATVTAGGGHLAAAAALEEAWRAIRPGDTVKQLDLVQFFSPLHRTIHADGYVKIVEHAPEVWGYLFKKTDNPELARKMTRLRRAFPSQSRHQFRDFLTEFAPDAVLCTHYLPLEALGMLRARAVERGGRGVRLGHRRRSPQAAAVNPFVVSVVTDFEAHALWMDACVDLYCVAAEHTGTRLLARGAKAAEVLATGIPISSRFSQKLDVAEIRKRHGLRDDLPIVLVLSGGFGMGPVREIAAELDKVEAGFQTIIITGRNHELRRELACEDRKHPTRVIGFSNGMHELMAVSEVVISKPGGLTTSEALAVGKPLLIINPIPGQEAANSDFLLEQGAASKVNRVEDLPFRLAELLGSRKLMEMARAARRLGRPQAAREICLAVASRLEKLPGRAPTQPTGEPAGK